MNGTLRGVWLPTLVLLLLSFGNLFVALRTGFFPHGFIMFSRISLLIYLPFLLGFALIGALGRHWCGRMRWESAIQLKLLVAQVIALAGAFAALSPVSFAVLAEAHSWNIGYFAECFLRWVFLPIAALVCGAVPFHLRSHYNRNQDGLYRSAGGERSH
jgi:hypothetical protein